MKPSIDCESVRQTVREGYGKIAGSGDSCCGPAPVASEDLAKHIGYSSEDLAALQSGEVVLDLGAGGGFDVFIAGRKVGAAGRVIGVDMTPEMLTKARKNIATYRERSGLNNVEFRLGEIEHLPLADASVDVVISNCVINLSPDKPQVWREIARVLKPGGRVAVSDMALLQPLPEQVRSMVEALVGCVAGAVLVRETESYARAAGLVNVEVKNDAGYVAALERYEDPRYLKIIAVLPAGARPADYIASVEVTARKPGNACGCGNKC